MKCLAISVLLFFAATTLQGQNMDSTASRARQALTSFYKKYPREKVFVHTDRELYASGQTIWFKCYATAYGKLTGLSSTIYVELADSAGNILNTKKLQLKGGMANGNIDLAASLHTGWYQLTSFSTWMLNFGEEGFYRQKIFVQNLAGAIAETANNEQKHRYHIAFFAEGGDPVEGNVCNIAFKATDEYGLPVKVDGDVLAYNQSPIAKIVTEHDGMGQFSMEGYHDKQNIAIVIFPDQSVQHVALPEFKKTGVTMQLNNLRPDALEVRIAFNGSPDQFHNMLLAAYQDNGVVDTYPLQLTLGLNVFTIQKKEFATGILRLSLFDGQGLPRAERIVFINKNDQLKLSLATDTLSFDPKAKSAFKVVALYADGKPATASFSIAVTDAGDAADTAQDNIYSYFFLSSELKNKVYHPAYYFASNSDAVKQQLDLVMLTSGWRHFKYDNDTLIRYPVERSQDIAGKIIGYDGQLFAKDRLKIKLLIQNQDSSKFIGYVTPDSTGSFILRNYDHSGKSDLFMEVADAKNHPRKLAIKLFDTQIDSLQHFCISPLTVTPADTKNVTDYFMANALNERAKQLQFNGIELKTINIRGRKVSPTDELINEHVSPLFTGNREFTLDLVNNPTVNIGILDYIQGRFPGLQIIEDGTTATFYYRGVHTLGGGQMKIAGGSKSGGASSTSSSSGTGTEAGQGGTFPYFYVNESPATFDDIKDISLYEVALIRFIPPPVMFAPYNGGNIGALMVYTKNNKDVRRTLESREKFDHYTFQGYSVTREFASPDYSDPGTKTLTDSRSTLFWDPNLNTGSSGEARFHFYNSDLAKKFRVIIQGIDADGRVGYLDVVL